MLGPLHTKIIKYQFNIIRNADIFWYENPGVLKPDQMAALAVRDLNSLIIKNTPLNSYSKNPFDINIPNFSIFDATLSGQGVFDTSAGMVIKWTYDQTDSSFIFQLCSNQNVWLAVGINDNNPTMNQGELYICSQSSGNWTVTTKYGKKASSAPATNNPNYIDPAKISDASSDCNTTYGVRFKRPSIVSVANMPVFTPYSILKGKKTNLLWAYGPDNDISNEHVPGSRGASSVPIDFYAALSCSGGGLIINGCAGVVVLETQLLLFHGIVMAILFLILAPASVYRIRYFKDTISLEFHRYVLLTGVFCAEMTIIFLLIGIQLKTEMTHSIIGLVIEI